MDLRIVADTATRLDVQSTSDQAGLWVMVSLVSGILLVATVMLWRRSRTLAVGLLTVAAGLWLWTAASLLRTGGVIDEFTMDRDANTFTTDSFFPRTGLPEETPVRRPLTSVLRADVEQNRNGALLVITLTSGDRVYPLGHSTRTLSNEFLIVDRITHLLQPAPPR